MACKFCTCTDCCNLDLPWPDALTKFSTLLYVRLPLVIESGMIYHLLVIPEVHHSMIIISYYSLLTLLFHLPFTIYHQYCYYYYRRYCCHCCFWLEGNCIPTTACNNKTLSVTIRDKNKKNISLHIVKPLMFLISLQSPVYIRRNQRGYHFFAFSISHWLFYWLLVHL